jgi:WD40-like Beta Propeller Repeat
MLYTWKLPVFIGTVFFIFLLSICAVTPKTYSATPGYNGRIAFASVRDTGATNLEIFTMNPDGSDVVRLTNAVGNDQLPTWSPDGTKIAFISVRDGNNEVYVMNADGTNQTRLTNHTSTDTTPTWSPDGTKIAFASTRPGNAEIYTMNASDGSNITRLTTNSVADQFPSWSPDGTKIAWQSLIPGNIEIYTMNTDGSGQTRITNTSAISGVPDWSPDGTKIAFASTRTGATEIYTMNSNGSNQTRITFTATSTSYNSYPAWSPDGTKISYTSLQNSGDPEIYVMDPSGGSQTRLTTSAGSDLYTSWQRLSTPLVIQPTTPPPSILTYTALGTHPHAATQPTLIGQVLRKLYVYNNKIYVAYGDTVTNTGPIAINAYDLTTRSFTGSLLTVQTEALNKYREIDGALYSPTIDPVSSGPAGFARGEPWINTTPITARHIFDMASYNGALYASGAEGLDGVVWRSTDNGVSWTVAYSESSPYTTNVRYNWIINYNNKLYTQAAVSDGAVRIFDGTSWTSGTTEQIATNDETPITFGGKIITKMNGLSTFDGTTLSTVAAFTGAAKDFYSADGYLYVLRTDNTVARTNNLMAWQELGVGPSASASIAVFSNRIYIGTTDSKIYESSIIDPTAVAKANALQSSELARTGTYINKTTILALLLSGIAIRVWVKRPSKYRLYGT